MRKTHTSKWSRGAVVVVVIADVRGACRRAATRRFGLLLLSNLVDACQQLRGC